MSLYLQLLSLLRQQVEDSEQELDFDDETDDEGDVQSWCPFKAIVPNWKDLEKMKMPTTVSKSIYTRLTGVYEYPVKNPPDFPPSEPRKARMSSRTNLLHDLTIHKADHCDEDCLYTRQQESIQVMIPCMNESETISINFPLTPEYTKVFRMKEVDSKTICIMTASYGRHWKARLNYNHVFKNDKGEIEPFIHMVFVRKQDSKPYVQYWGNYVAIVEIPEEMNDIEENVDIGGIGYARRFIQRFCYEYNVKGFYMADDSLVYLKQFQSLSEESKNISMLTLHNQLQKIGSVTENVPMTVGDYEHHEMYPDSKVIASYSGPQETFALIGARKTRASNQIKTLHAKRQCTSFYWMNNSLLVERNILFQPWKAWEDLNLSNQADADSLNVVKLMSIEFVKIHSRDNLILYEWKDSDFRFDQMSAKQSDVKMVEKILLNFVKTCRLKVIEGTLGSSHDELEDKIKSVKVMTSGGSILILGDEFDFEEVPPLQQYIFVFKQFNSQCRRVKNKDEMSEWFSQKMNCTVSVKAVFSTHKPPVKNDYWIILVSKVTQRIIKKKFPSQSDEEVDETHYSRNENSTIVHLLRQILQNQKDTSDRISQMESEQRSINENLKEMKEHSKSMDERQKNLEDYEKKLEEDRLQQKDTLEQMDKRNQLMEDRQVAMNQAQMDMDQQIVQILEHQKTQEKHDSTMLKQQKDLQEKVDNLRKSVDECQSEMLQSRSTDQGLESISESEEEITTTESPRKRRRYGK